MIHDLDVALVKGATNWKNLNSVEVPLQYVSYRRTLCELPRFSSFTIILQTASTGEIIFGYMQTDY